jgi:hypothetical protein
MIAKSGYGLFHKEKKVLLGVRIDHTDGSEGVRDVHTLDYGVEPIWLVADITTAAYVRENSTPWYNAGYDTPTNPFEPAELRVVKIELKISNPGHIKLPTFEEHMSLKYNTPGEKFYNPAHYEMVMAEYRAGAGYRYSLYDLIGLIEAGRWKL